MNGTEAIKQGIYGWYLADRARQLEAEFRAIVVPGGTPDPDFGLRLAQWAGRASVTLGLVADEFGALPGPVPDCPVCGSQPVWCHYNDGRPSAFKTACGHAS